MERLVSYAAAMLASLIGWQVCRPLGPVAGTIVSSVLAASAMYCVRRWWQKHLG
jgi:hypothetical protein